MQKFKSVSLELLILTASTLVIASSVFFFLYPSGACISSISGLSMILNHVFPVLPTSAYAMILNVVLLIIGYFTVGKEFSYKTVYTSILLPLFLFMYEQCLPEFTSLTGMPWLDVVCHIFLVSIGLMILFTRNASSGGLDIIAMILHKYLHIDLGKAMSAVGMLIAASTFFVYTPQIAIISILGTYLNGMILDHFIFGRNMKRRVCVISDKMDEIRDFLLYDLHSGASMYEVIGAYKMEKHMELITILNNREFQKFREFMDKCDPNAFITIYQVSNMHYRTKPMVQRPSEAEHMVQDYLSKQSPVEK